MGFRRTDTIRFSAAAGQRDYTNGIFIAPNSIQPILTNHQHTRLIGWSFRYVRPASIWGWEWWLGERTRMDRETLGRLYPRPFWGRLEHVLHGEFQTHWPKELGNERRKSDSLKDSLWRNFGSKGLLRDHWGSRIEEELKVHFVELKWWHLWGLEKRRCPDQKVTRNYLVHGILKRDAFLLFSKRFPIDDSGTPTNFG